jgi:hypothetical protein
MRRPRSLAEQRPRLLDERFLDVLAQLLGRLAGLAALAAALPFITTRRTTLSRWKPASRSMAVKAPDGSIRPPVIVANAPIFA